jgi:transposase
VEYRERIIELVRTGRSAESLAQEYEPTANTIRKWVAQADREEGRGDDGLSTSDREELRRLQRELTQLKMEREILAKVTAWFARETERMPPDVLRS